MNKEEFDKKIGDIIQKNTARAIFDDKLWKEFCYCDSPDGTFISNKEDDRGLCAICFFKNKLKKKWCEE